MTSMRHDRSVPVSGNTGSTAGKGSIRASSRFLASRLCFPHTIGSLTQSNVHCTVMHCTRKVLWLSLHIKARKQHSHVHNMIKPDGRENGTAQQCYETVCDSLIPDHVYRTKLQQCHAVQHVKPAASELGVSGKWDMGKKAWIRIV